MLEHLLGDDATIAADRGVFLEQTWRMHPDVCGFISEIVYEGRLDSPDDVRASASTSTACPEPACATSRSSTTATAAARDEEAEAIAAADRRRCSAAHVHRRATAITRPLARATSWSSRRTTPRCAASASALPAGVAVGTVDKFQGQEAPVVFFSMATLERRGRAARPRLPLLPQPAERRHLARAVPGGARLLAARCSRRAAGRVEQMRLVNALCRLVEVATRGQGRESSLEANARRRRG